MIVADASLVIEISLGTERGVRALGQIIEADETLHAPHLVDLEVVQTLRRLVSAGTLESFWGDFALRDFRQLRIDRYPHEPLLSRIWDLRHNLTAYDAAYVALAEGLRAPIWTLDRKMAGAAGTEVQFEIVE